MKKIKLLALSLLVVLGLQADEGMWMLSSLKEMNIEEMNRLGNELTAEEIFSNTKSSLKDAVVIFGGGCTGIIVSPNGLLFTNHHCGYSAIQQHSTVERNILKNGFTAVNIQDEIPTPGLAVTFLVRTEDVTDRIVPHLNGLEGDVRHNAVDSISQIIETEAAKGNHYIPEVRSFYAQNEYHLFVYERFTDVRLAYAPPSSIGKFGGDTDNWMYPRHTGDFSVFRVYSAPDGTPADYAQENIPYKPRKYVTISNQGYKENDFAMILGNPGSTNRYATSWAIKNRRDNGNQARIEMRGVKQDVWKSFMRKDEAINIAYANKYAGSSNYWKNSIGMNNAIKKLDVIGDKTLQEHTFTQWAVANKPCTENYLNVLPSLQKEYAAIENTKHAISYLQESLLSGVELPRMANYISKQVKSDADPVKVIEDLKSSYKDYYPEVDKATMMALLKAYRNSVQESELPSLYQTIDKKFKGNYAKYVDNLFKKSVYTDLDKLSRAMKNRKFDARKDPAIDFYNSVYATIKQLASSDFYNSLDTISHYERLYMQGLMQKANEEKVPLYPDANFTMRLTYGTIQGYKPADAISYKYYTTTTGIQEKEDDNNPEFVVPMALKQLIQNKDFGSYADKESGKMLVNFISNNDITGGNSGSPVFNGKGELIGLAFDGNWEAMSGDLIFENVLQRCINVDIRYVLFVMEKYGKANRLINELEVH